MNTKKTVRTLSTLSAAGFLSVAMLGLAGAPALAGTGGAQPGPAASGGTWHGLVVLDVDYGPEPVDGKKGENKPKVVEDPRAGVWHGLVQKGDGSFEYVGSYDSEGAAAIAASRKASEMNGGNVMDGPGCEPPFVLC